MEASVLIVAEAFVNGAVLRDVLSKFGELYSFEPLDVDGLVRFELGNGEYN